MSLSFRGTVSLHRLYIFQQSEFSQDKVTVPTECSTYLLGHIILCFTFKSSYSCWVSDRGREERKGKKFSSQPETGANNIPSTLISPFTYIDILIIKDCTHLRQTSISWNEQPCGLEWCTGWRACRKVQEKKLQERKTWVYAVGQAMSQVIIVLKILEYLSSPACNNIRSLFILLFQKVRIAQNVTWTSGRLFPVFMFLSTWEIRLAISNVWAFDIVELWRITDDLTVQRLI